MHIVHRSFRWPWQCARAIQMALLNAACPGLLRKPLDADIGQLLTLYRPSGRQGNNQQNNNQTIHTLCWMFWWLSRCSGTIQRASPERGGSGLQQNPLVASIGPVLWPMIDFRHRYIEFFWVFSLPTRYKRDRGDVEDPNNNRGMTYQSNGKELENTMQ